jgi:type II secretory pathway component PulF
MARQAVPNAEEFEQFNEQLRQLLASGVPLDEGMARFAGEIHRASFREAVGKVSAALKTGHPLSASLDSSGVAFSSEYLALVRAGEASGDLLGVLDTAIDHGRFLGQLDRGLRREVLYPLAVVGLTLAVFALFFSFTGPVLIHLFGILERPVPGQLEVLQMIVGPDGLHAYALIMIGAATGWIVTRRVGLGVIALSLPGIRPVILHAYAGRIAKTVGSVLAHGVRADKALMLVAELTGDPGFRSRLTRAAAQVTAGTSLSQALAGIGLKESGLAELVALGEETGQLPVLLAGGAELYQLESQARLALAIRTLGTVLLLGAGAWALFLLLSLFSALTLVPSAMP